MSSSCTIHRSEKSRENPYAQISRKMAQDSNLSFQARGLLLYILSKPPKWKGLSSDLQREGRIKEKALKNILDELIQRRYVVRHEVRKRGRFNYTLEVFEEPELNDFLANQVECLTVPPSRGGGTAPPSRLPREVGAAIDSTCAGAFSSSEKREREITPLPPKLPRRQPTAESLATQTHINELLTELESEINELPPRERSREAGDLKWLLKNYTPDQMRACLRYYRHEDPWWKTHRATWATVAKLIGDWVAKGEPETAKTTSSYHSNGNGKGNFINGYRVGEVVTPDHGDGRFTVMGADGTPTKQWNNIDAMLDDLGWDKEEYHRLHGPETDVALAIKR